MTIKTPKTIHEKLNFLEKNARENIYRTTNSNTSKKYINENKIIDDIMFELNLMVKSQEKLMLSDKRYHQTLYKTFQKLIETAYEKNKTITPWICKDCKISNPESEDYCRKCGKERKSVKLP